MKKHLRPRYWHGLAVLFWILWQSCPGAPAVLRLSGTFMQYQEEMKSWSPAVWHQVLEQMKELKMDTVFIQMLAAENANGTTNSFIGPSGTEDATEAILNYADTNGFKVYLGLYLHQYHDLSDTNFLNKALADNVGVAQQAWQRYMQSHPHASFAGWYAPMEPWTAAWSAPQIGALRSFYRGVHDACMALSGEVPFAIAPSISADRPSPCTVQQVYLQLLFGSGIDILLLQDSVGAQQWQDDIASRAAPYFAAVQTACQTRGVQLWADTESFLITPTNWLACDLGRLKQQLTMAAPYVERFITFDFLNYMNTAAYLSSWNDDRRASMQRLFADYRAELVDTDFAPLAPLEILPTWTGTDLSLSWHGAPGDQYQLETRTNLSEGAWNPLDVPEMAHDTWFSVAAVNSEGTTSRYYRVMRRPRLQLPDSMVWISPGSFLMGTAANDPARTEYPMVTESELLPFTVVLTNGFWMSRNEVRQWEYQDIMCANPSTFADDLENPVETVNWTQAQYYCSRLTQRERTAGRLPDAYVYRLPTEAEWEYAARAGTTGWYSFGELPTLLPDYGWFATNSLVMTHPAGARLANPWGLKDIHGNVAEWCWDWIAAAPAGAVTNFIGQTNGSLHAIRGGSWNSSWVECRSSWRTGRAPALVDPAVGFRVVVAPAP